MIEQKKEKKSIILFFVINVPNLTANNQVEQFLGVKMVSFLFLSKHYNTTALLANHLHPWEETKGQSLAWKALPFESYILMDQPLNSLMNIIDKGIISGNWDRKKIWWMNESINQSIFREKKKQMKNIGLFDGPGRSTCWWWWRWRWSPTTGGWRAPRGWWWHSPSCRPPWKGSKGLAGEEPSKTGRATLCISTIFSIN